MLIANLDFETIYKSEFFQKFDESSIQALK